MPAFKKSNCVCPIKCAWHPSASMRDWDGTADCLAPLVWGHVKWLDCHPWHFPGKKKHGVSAKLMVGEVRVFGWTLHTQKYVNGHMNFPDCCCIVRFVSLIWGTLWNDAKNRFALGLCRCLACKHPTLGKDTLCHALAMERNPQDIYVNIYLGGNISSEWSVLPSATGALAAIAKCQHYKKGIASYSASITQHVKTANLWLKSDWNRTVWWNDRESRNCKEEKLRPSFEMPHNANKQGRNFSPYFCCEVIKHFSIKISFGAPWRHWR